MPKTILSTKCRKGSTTVSNNNQGLTAQTNIYYSGQKNQCIYSVHFVVYFTHLFHSFFLRSHCGKYTHWADYKNLLLELHLCRRIKDKHWLRSRHTQLLTLKYHTTTATLSKVNTRLLRNILIHCMVTGCITVYIKQLHATKKQTLECRHKGE